MKTSFIREWTLDWRAYLAEFMGTFVFVLISSIAILTDIFYAELGVLGISFAVGFSYSALVYITAYHTTGFLNPAVTIGLWLVHKLNAAKAIFFILAQILASFAAAGVVFLIFGSTALQFGFGIPTLGINVLPQVAVIIEAILTAILVYAVVSTMIDKRGPVSFGPLVLGLILVSAQIVAGPITGASLNPARVIGGAVISGNLENIIVYIVGPLTGALFAMVYEYLFLKKYFKSK